MWRPKKSKEPNDTRPKFKNLRVPSLGVHAPIPIRIRTKHEEVAFVAAGDFHIGADAFNMKAFNVFLRQLVDESKKRQVYLILMGDLFDNILPTDRRYRRADQANTINEAMDFLTEALKWLRKESKNRVHIVGTLTGNHELQNAGGTNEPVITLQQTAGVEPLGCGCYLNFDFYWGKKRLNTLRVFAFHGCTCARASGSHVNLLQKIVEQNGYFFDEHVRHVKLNFMGHIHAARVEPVIRQIYGRDQKRRQTVQYAASTGTFFDTGAVGKNSYAADKNYSPLPVAYIKAIVDPSNTVKHISVVMKNLNPDIIDCDNLEI